MNWTDLYQTTPNTASGTGQLATGPMGPNQSIVTGAGQSMGPNGTAAAFSWLGLGLALVLMRVLIAWGGRVA